MGFRLSFFKTPQHRVFRYNPIYWDPEKEARDERLYPDLKPTGKLVRGSFQKALLDSRRHAKGKADTLIRIIIFITLAALIFSAFYFTKFLEIVLQKFYP